MLSAGAYAALPTLIAALFFAVASLASAQAPAIGQIVDRVACPSDATQTYALYLPRAYTPDRRWPLLFIFDPRGRGEQAAHVFREAAERFGWIIASSNNTSSDGDWEPNRRALGAMWPDVRAAYAIDQRRIYATGFSGGATVARILAQSSGGVTGIIAVGAPDLVDAKRPPGVRAWFSTAGRLDFNYLDTKRTIERLAGSGRELSGADPQERIVSRVEFFAGAHSWLPPALAMRALAWLEMRAMKDRLRTADAELARTLTAEDVAYAHDLDKSGHTTEAHAAFQTIVMDYRGLTDVSAAETAMQALDARDDFKRARRDESRIDAREGASRNELAKTLRQLFEPELPLSGQLIQALNIESLRRRAAGSDYDAQSARRILEVLAVQTGFYIPRDFERQKHYDRAALALEIATAAHPERPRPWVELAANRARLNQKSRALDALSRAIDAGFRDGKTLAADPRFESIRPAAEFQKLLDSLGRLGGA